MPTYNIPDAKSVEEMLRLFFGEGTTVADAAPPDKALTHVATFISDSDDLVAAILCDPNFVAYSGAAFSMLPAEVANEMVQENSFSDIVKANFHEVMNICSRLLMTDSSAHLRLDKTLAPADAAASVAALEGPGELQSFRIDIPNYGSGVLAALVT